MAQATMGLDVSNRWTETRGYKSRLRPRTLQTRFPPAIEYNRVGCPPPPY
jgi:hypothetical protein